MGFDTLEIGLSYARPYKPQGKGKIERFFRTVRTQFLPELPETLSPEELNTRYTAYLDDVFHVRIHGTTGQTPPERYLADAKSLRQAPHDLPEYCRKKATRKVNNDRSVKIDYGPKKTEYSNMNGKNTAPVHPENEEEPEKVPVNAGTRVSVICDREDANNDSLDDAETDFIIECPSIPYG